MALACSCRLNNAALASLRKEWFSVPQPPAPPHEFVAGRSIDGRTARILRESLLTMLKQESADIRDNIARIAHALEDLTRQRVLALADGPRARRQ